jgi:hypothetical protein
MFIITAKGVGMNLHPARDELAARKKREEIELCGKNRGPHDYMPIEWISHEGIERVTRLICRTCFCNVDIATLLVTYRNISEQ